MTFEEFRVTYNDSYEYWHEEAKLRSSSTTLHGFTQAIVGRLLSEAGYLAGASVEWNCALNQMPCHYRMFLQRVDQ